MNTFRRTTLLIVTLIASAVTAEAQLHRGLWFWGSTTLPGGDASPYGSIDVVGDSVAEDESINFFNTHGVKRIYGSYQNRPVAPAAEKAKIAAWNTKLDAAGIESQLLLDGNAVNDSVWMDGLLVKIDNRLINFNNSFGADEASKFKALHLDLEPQGLGLWSDHLDKRLLLGHLLQAYVDIRDHLDAAGFTTMPIYADIPFFYDKMWDGSEGVGWASTTDRDDWYTDVAAVIDGISIMTFSKDNFASIDTATAYERSGSMLGIARVAIQPKIGPGELWSNVLVYNGVMNQLELNYGSGGATDIENYGFWRDALTITAVIGVEVTDAGIIWGTVG
ncbi:MAG: hypothetical protein ACI9NC_005622, partial [Verrucomicrobiales bacterium]